MKATTEKASTTSNAHSSKKPFFNKSGEGGFFSPSTEAKQPFFNYPTIQPKLTIGKPNDKYEQEADTMADKVMKMPQPSSIQRKCEGCEEEESIQTKPSIRKMEDSDKEELQTKPLIMDSKGGGGEATSNLTSQLSQSKGGGSPMPENTNQFMGNAFSTDFSHVRVHTGGNAVQMNQDLNARAFTHGSDVYFNKGEYSPESSGGKKLLAHELTHVVQQGKGLIQNKVQKQGFSSTMEICHRVLKSRKFRVSNSGIRVTTNVRISDPGNPNCHHHSFWIELRKKGVIFDDSYGSCEFNTGAQPDSKAWGGIPEGEYELIIHRVYNNPYCCMLGDIEVIEESGIEEGSCTRLPEGPIEIVHFALQAAGMIPALGIIPDAIDTGIYMIQGDWVNSGISAAAMIPVFGQGATVTRAGVRLTREAIERTGREGIERGLRAARAVRIGSGFIEMVLASARRLVGNSSAALRKLQRRISDPDSLGLFRNIPLDDESAIRLVGNILDNARTQRFGRIKMSGFAGERGIAIFDEAGRGILVRQSDGLFITFLEEGRGLGNIFR